MVFTYVHAGLLDGRQSFEGGEHTLRNVRKLREPWTFGLYADKVASFLADRGLSMLEDAGADDYRQRYLGDSPRLRRGYVFYRIAVASVRL